VGSVSTWLQANNWANGQASLTQQVVTEQAAANSALASAQSNYYQGIAGLAVTVALKRLLAQGKPEPARAESQRSSVPDATGKLALVRPARRPKQRPRPLRDARIAYGEISWRSPLAGKAV
jgi:hypothetical protein